MEPQLHDDPVQCVLARRFVATLAETSREALARYLQADSDNPLPIATANMTLPFEAYFDFCLAANRARVPASFGYFCRIS